MVLTAAGLGACSVWYHRAQTAQSVAFWGPDVGKLVASAPHVEVFRLRWGSKVTDAVDALEFDGREYFLRDGRDISRAPGLTHMRTALLTDASFDWQQPDPKSPTNWQYALRFSREGETVLAAVSLVDARLGRASRTPRTVSIEPIARGMTAFLEEQFATPKQ